MRVQLTAHQAATIRQQIVDVNLHEELHKQAQELRRQANKQLTDMLLKDKSVDPKNYPAYELTEDEDGPYMQLFTLEELQAKQNPQPAPAPAPTPDHTPETEE